MQKMNSLTTYKFKLFSTSVSRSCMNSLTTYKFRLFSTSVSRPCMNDVKDAIGIKLRVFSMLHDNDLSQKYEDEMKNLSKISSLEEVTFFVITNKKDTSTNVMFSFLIKNFIPVVSDAIQALNNLKRLFGKTKRARDIINKFEKPFSLIEQNLLKLRYQDPSIISIDQKEDILSIAEYKHITLPDLQEVNFTPMALSSIKFLLNDLKEKLNLKFTIKVLPIKIMSTTDKRTFSELDRYINCNLNGIYDFIDMLKTQKDKKEKHEKKDKTKKKKENSNDESL